MRRKWRRYGKPNRSNPEAVLSRPDTDLRQHIAQRSSSFETLIGDAVTSPYILKKSGESPT